jgi:hypothetical protein
VKTSFILLAQYNGSAIVPIETVQRDYFPHIGVEKLVAKMVRGEIALPLVRIEPRSKKSSRSVHVDDLACWIDARREAAMKELRAVTT